MKLVGDLFCFSPKPPRSFPRSPPWQLAGTQNEPQPKKGWTQLRSTFLILRTAIGMECLASNDLCSGRLWGHMCDGAHARCSDCHPYGGRLGELADCVRVTALEHWLALENSALARVGELCAGSSSTGQVDPTRNSKQDMQQCPLS